MNNITYHISISMPTKSVSRTKKTKRTSTQSKAMKALRSARARKVAKLGAAGAGTLGALLLAKYLHKRMANREMNYSMGPTGISAALLSSLKNRFASKPKTGGAKKKVHRKKKTSRK